VANLPANQLVEEVTPEQYAFNPAYSTPKTVYESKGVRAMLMHSQYHQDNNGLIRLTLRNKETVANVDNYSNAIVLNDAFRQKNKAFIERMADSYGVIVKLEQDNFGNTTFQLNGRTSQQATILQQLISEFKSFEIDKKQVKSSVWIKTAAVFLINCCSIPFNPQVQRHIYLTLRIVMLDFGVLSLSQLPRYKKTYWMHRSWILLLLVITSLHNLQR
jgi:hypothetical protein